MLGQSLFQSFQNAIRRCPVPGAIREECLFRALCQALNNLPPYHSQVIHSYAKSGTEFYVSINFYNPTRPNRTPIKKELADLLIVAYSPRKRQARLTFMQNKYNRRRSTAFPFDADPLQWYLLSRRPRLVSCKIPFVDHNFLRDALLPSVGSYGVFYRVPGSPYGFNMGYSRAIDLYRTSGRPYPIKSSAPQILDTKNNVAAKTFDLGVPSFPDYHWCDNIVDFGDELEDLHIGTPIDNSVRDKLVSAFPDAPNDFSEAFFYIEGGPEQEDNLNDVRFEAITRRVIEDEEAGIVAAFINVDQEH